MVKRMTKPKYGYAPKMRTYMGLKGQEYWMEKRDRQFHDIQPDELGPKYRFYDGTRQPTRKESRQLLAAQQEILRRRAEPNYEVSTMVKTTKPPRNYSNAPASLRVKNPPKNRSTPKEGRKKKPSTRVAKTASRARYGY